MSASRVNARKASTRVKGRDGLVQFLRERRGSILVRHNFDIGARSASLGRSDGLIEFAASRHPSREPAVAAERFGKLVVAPLSDIVVIDIRVFAEQSLNQIAVVIEDEDNRLEAKTVELADFLCRHLKRSLAGDQDGSAVWS